MAKAAPTRSFAKKRKAVMPSRLLWKPRALKRSVAAKGSDAASSVGLNTASVAGLTSKQFLSNVKSPRALGVDVKLLKAYEVAMKRLVEQGSMPGCASVIFRRGEIIHTGCWGLADIEARRRFTFDSICRLYCMTKSYIVVCFMTLVEEGLADLEDRLDKYIPAFAKSRVKPSDSSKAVRPKTPILLKHVLSHTSGIQYPPEIPEVAQSDTEKTYEALVAAVLKGSIRSLKTFVERVATCPLACHPGEGYHYGFSMDVVGRVIEIITGKSIEEALDERVFGPLGMKDTRWGVPDCDLKRLAAAYCSPRTWGCLYGDRKGMVPTAPRPGLCRFDGDVAEESRFRQGRRCPVLSGGGFMNYEYGGLVGTVADTARFVHMVINRGVMLNGQRLLQDKTFDLLEKKRLKKSWGQGQACYLGNVGVFRDGGREVGMGGAACTYWSVDREDDVATIWFTQNVDFPDLEAEGVPPNADLWKLMHKAVGRAPTKRKASGRTGGTKKRRVASLAVPEGKK